MSLGRRSVRVGDQILREMALLLIQKVRDPRVQEVTLTGIRLSNDLKDARVYFSIVGDEKRIRQAEAGLNSAKGYIKREIGLRLSLRYVPELRFVHDASLEVGEHMERIIEALSKTESRDTIDDG